MKKATLKSPAPVFPLTTVLPLTTIFLLLFLASTPLAADAEPKVEKFSLHGFITQAYAVADGLQVLGIPEDGTFDYRNLALQLRYDLNASNSFLLQLSHARTGESPFQDLEKDVEIDWALYEHRFASGTRIRVGRYPVPFGIYNQIRDVGTVLEFYRPPVSVYFEGAFTTERADGFGVTHNVSWAEGDWSLDLEAYWGEWDRLEALAPVVSADNVVEAKAKDGFGTQVWLNTPVDSLRFGLASQHFSLEDRGFIQVDPAGDPLNSYLFSVEVDLERFKVHSEIYYLDLRVVGLEQIDFWSYYLQPTYVINDRMQVSLQYERSDSKTPNGEFDISPFFEDIGAAFTYRWPSQVMLRLEAHHSRGSLFEEFPADGILPGESDYGILSLSYSF